MQKNKTATSRYRTDFFYTTNIIDGLAQAITEINAKKKDQRYSQMKLMFASIIALLIHPPANANLINKREYNMFILGRVVGATEVVFRENVSINKQNIYADPKQIFNETKEIPPYKIVEQAWKDVRNNCRTIGGVDIGEL